MDQIGYSYDLFRKFLRETKGFNPDGGACVYPVEVWVRGEDEILIFSTDTSDIALNRIEDLLTDADSNIQQWKEFLENQNGNPNPIAS